MPQYRTSDLDRLVAGLLADDVMDTWSDNLNTIIDTLKPEGAGPREPGQGPQQQRAQAEDAT